MPSTDDKVRAYAGVFGVDIDHELGNGGKLGVAILHATVQNSNDICSLRGEFEIHRDAAAAHRELINKQMMGLFSVVAGLGILGFNRVAPAIGSTIELVMQHDYPPIFGDSLPQDVLNTIGGILICIGLILMWRFDLMKWFVGRLVSSVEDKK